jgi:hypothetical protein
MSECVIRLIRLARSHQAREQSVDPRKASVKADGSLDNRNACAIAYVLRRREGGRDWAHRLFACSAVIAPCALRPVIVDLPDSDRLALHRSLVATSSFTLQVRSLCCTSWTPRCCPARGAPGSRALGGAGASSIVAFHAKRKNGKRPPQSTAAIWFTLLYISPCFATRHNYSKQVRLTHTKLQSLDK